jgi:NADH-quinone oxidoreductase subunit C
LAEPIRTADIEALTELGEYVRSRLAADVLDIAVANGELMVLVRREAIVRALTFLREDSQCLFKVLVDICGVDYPDRPERFEVVYNLLSLTQNHRIRVKVTTDEDTPVPSVTRAFSAANWYERETWDLYGVMFSDHPDLRRILTDYGFDGHPLRKDFPLTGFVQVRYDEEQKRVVNEPVKLGQEFRRFDFMSPWEGAQYILPGDEKAAAVPPAAPPPKAS